MTTALAIMLFAEAAEKAAASASTSDPGPSVELLKEFLNRVQAPPNPPPPPPDLPNWVLIDPATNTYEHALWIGSEPLEGMLGNDLHSSTIRSSELRSKNQKERLRFLLSLPKRFLAVVEDDYRFEYLVDRSVLLEQVASRLSSDADGG